MNAKLSKQIKARKRRIEKRLQTPADGRQTPELAATNIHYEISERQQAVACGGIGLIHQMVNQLELAESINRDAPLFKLYLPYSESDHVLNMAYNILAGGTCLEHLEYRRNDEAYLNALGDINGRGLISVGGVGSKNSADEPEKNRKETERKEKEKKKERLYHGMSG